jgi:hypothetical protein
MEALRQRRQARDLHAGRRRPANTGKQNYDLGREKQVRAIRHRSESQHFKVPVEAEFALGLSVKTGQSERAKD